jgi:hypothetical protein
MSEILTEAELETLKACRSDDEWNDACLAIKKAHGGQYPYDWYGKVLATGLMAEVVKKFGGSTEISIQAVDPRR